MKELKSMLEGIGIVVGEAPRERQAVILGSRREILRLTKNHMSSNREVMQISQKKQRVTPIVIRLDSPKPYEGRGDTCDRDAVNAAFEWEQMRYKQENPGIEELLNTIFGTKGEEEKND